MPWCRAIRNTRAWATSTATRPSVASFTKEVNPRLAKRPLIFNGHLANCGLTSLVKEATRVMPENPGKLTWISIWIFLRIWVPGLNELIAHDGVKLPPHPGIRWCGTYQPPSDGLRGNQSMVTTGLEPAHVLYQCPGSMHTGSSSLTHWPLEDFKYILHE